MLKGWTGKCVRLSRPLVGFWTYFKSVHFHSFISFVHSFIHSFIETLFRWNGKYLYRVAADLFANSFCRPLSQVNVCTIFFLLKPSQVLITFVTGNIHTCFPLFNIRSLKILTSIVVYLNMYNPLIVILCFLSVHIAHFLLCVLYFLVYFIVVPPCNDVPLSYWIKSYLLTYLLTCSGNYT